MTNLMLDCCEKSLRNPLNHCAPPKRKGKVHVDASLHDFGWQPRIKAYRQRLADDRARWEIKRYSGLALCGNCGRIVKSKLPAGLEPLRKLLTPTTLAFAGQMGCCCTTVSCGLPSGSFTSCPGCMSGTVPNVIETTISGITNGTVPGHCTNCENANGTYVCQKVGVYVTGGYVSVWGYEPGTLVCNGALTIWAVIILTAFNYVGPNVVVSQCSGFEAPGYGDAVLTWTGDATPWIMDCSIERSLPYFFDVGAGKCKSDGTPPTWIPA